MHLSRSVLLHLAKANLQRYCYQKQQKRETKLESSNKPAQLEITRKEKVAYMHQHQFTLIGVFLSHTLATQTQLQGRKVSPVAKKEVVNRALFELLPELTEDLTSVFFSFPLLMDNTSFILTVCHNGSFSEWHSNSQSGTEDKHTRNID